MSLTRSSRAGIVCIEETMQRASASVISQARLMLSLAASTRRRASASASLPRVWARTIFASDVFLARAIWHAVGYFDRTASASGP